MSFFKTGVVYFGSFLTENNDLNRIFYAAILITIVCSCSPKISPQILAKQTPLWDGDFVLVLQQQDPFNNGGLEVGTIKLGDNGLSTNCTYNEVIGTLQQIARRAGANVIKITERKSPDRWSSCERLTAKLYKVPDFKKHEKEIEWTANRKLTWDDFKGSPKSVSILNAGAQTYCGFGFQSNSLTILSRAKIFVKTTFACDSSWVRPDQKYRADLLEHEQGHFDISEIYARALKKKFVEKKLTIFNVNQEATNFFKEVYALYVERQELYEKETGYGLSRQKQIEWTTQINLELNQPGGNAPQ